MRLNSHTNQVQRFVLQAVDEQLKRPLEQRYWHVSALERRRRRVDQDINPPIEQALDVGPYVEIIYGASGNALVLTNTRDTVFS